MRRMLIKDTNYMLHCKKIYDYFYSNTPILQQIRLRPTTVSFFNIISSNEEVIEAIQAWFAKLYTFFEKFTGIAGSL